MIRVFTEWFFGTDIENNIHALAIEIHKVVNDMLLDIMNEVLKIKKNSTL